MHQYPVPCIQGFQVDVSDLATPDVANCAFACCVIAGGLVASQPCDWQIPTLEELTAAGNSCGCKHTFAYQWTNEIV